MVNLKDEQATEISTRVNPQPNTQFTLSFEQQIILSLVIFLSTVILILIGLVAYFANRRPHAENADVQLPAGGFPERDAWYPSDTFEKKYFGNDPTSCPTEVVTETEV